MQNNGMNITAQDLLDLTKAVESLSVMQNMLRKDVDKLNAIVKEGSTKPSMLETLALVNNHIENIKNEIDFLKQDLTTIREHMSSFSDSNLQDSNKKIIAVKEELNQKINNLTNSIEQARRTRNERNFQWLKAVVVFSLGAGLNLLVLFLTGSISL